jgi:hypothetical protein
VEHRIGDCRGNADDANLAESFDSEWIQSRRPSPKLGRPLTTPSRLNWHSARRCARRRSREHDYECHRTADLAQRRTPHDNRRRPLYCVPHTRHSGFRARERDGRTGVRGTSIPLRSAFSTTP